jgi:hypothetical protein
MANGNLNPYDKVSIFNRSFWDLWFQKIFRNFASIKYQFMIAFFYLICYGMFWAKNSDGEPFISATAGLTFLGGGFITLITSRMLVRTSLFESRDDGGMDTDR